MLFIAIVYCVGLLVANRSKQQPLSLLSRAAQRLDGGDCVVGFNRGSEKEDAGKFVAHLITVIVFEQQCQLEKLDPNTASI